MKSRKKTHTPPTLEERANAASATAAAALSTFELAAADLEYAASEHDDVAALAQAEIDRLADVRDEAFDNAARCESAAAKIRELVA